MAERENTVQTAQLPGMRGRRLGRVGSLGEPRLCYWPHSSVRKQGSTGGTGRPMLAVRSLNEREEIETGSVTSLEVCW